MVYDIPCGRYGPTLDTISQVLGSLPKYGIQPPSTTSDIWTMLRRHALGDPYYAYALCASAAVEEHCIYVSQLTLSLSPNHITEAEALMIGPIYLRRLCFLHLGRQEALRRIIAAELPEHEPVPGCSQDVRNLVKLRWDAAVAEVLLRQESQNLSPGEIMTVLGSVRAAIPCAICQGSVTAHMRACVEQWASVKKTI